MPFDKCGWSLHENVETKIICVSSLSHCLVCVWSVLCCECCEQQKPFNNTVIFAVTRKTVTKSNMICICHSDGNN